MKFTDRVAHAKTQLKPFKTQYAVVYDDIDMKCCGVMYPDPHAMAALMAGGVFPPIEVFWKLASDAAQPNFKKHTRLHLLDDAPKEAAKTEAEAVEFLIMKDVPMHIWQNYKASNSVNMVICRKEQLPQTREWRNAWRISDELAA